MSSILKVAFPRKRSIKATDTDNFEFRETFPGELPDDNSSRGNLDEEQEGAVSFHDRCLRLLSSNAGKVKLNLHQAADTSGIATYRFGVTDGGERVRVNLRVKQTGQFESFEVVAVELNKDGYVVTSMYEGKEVGDVVFVLYQ